MNYDHRQLHLAVKDFFRSTGYAAHEEARQQVRLCLLKQDRIWTNGVHLFDEAGYELSGHAAELQTRSYGFREVPQLIVWLKNNQPKGEQPK